MICHKCGEPAMGVCVFCGRAVCQEHHKTVMPNILSMYPGRDNVLKAVVVSNVLWCTECNLQPEPIEVPEFY